MSPDLKSTRSAEGTKTLEAWSALLQRIRQRLPQQNPLGSFLHNNMLASWENQEFWSGIAHASELYGAEAPRPLKFYFEAWRRGRLTSSSIRMALASTLAKEDKWMSEDSSHESWLDWIEILMLAGPRTPLLNLLQLPQAKPSPATREELEEGKDPWVFRLSDRVTIRPGLIPEAAIHWLCRVTESFLDQGLSLWANPFQSEGLLSFVRELGRHAWIVQGSWQRRLFERLPRTESRTFLLARWQASGLSIDAWERLCLRLLFTVKGWAGMTSKRETEADWWQFRQVDSSLEDLLVILFILTEVFALSQDELSRPWGLEPASPEDRYLRLAPEVLAASLESLIPGRGKIEQEEWGNLAKGLHFFSEIQTRIAWHLAYENSAHESALRKIGQQLQPKSPGHAAKKPRLQILCCMDDREESLRRHIEAVDSEVLTYGVLGNFGLDMRFQALEQLRPLQQCPPVIKPRRVLSEKLRDEERPFPLKKALLASFETRPFGTSRSLVRGFFSTLVLGGLSFVPLAAQVLSPVWAHSLQRRSRRRRATLISLLPSVHPEHGAAGYTYDEQAAIVQSILATILPCREWAPLLIALGHQSTSTNNPYRQAYGCGACSGNSGAPNARIFAQMANDPEVRARLAVRGIDIPDSTHVLGAVHDTASDTLLTFDEDLLLAKPGGEGLLKTFQCILGEALRHNAKERCQTLVRGSSLTLERSKKQLLRRSLNPAEVRPEYGHAGTHLAIFARRELTREISLNRHSFLISYDSAGDQSGEVLEGLLHGAMPVVANITLDYFFSALDAQGFGAGSKLPLNVSGLLGVLTGSEGDLRLGLTEQMIEVHDPVRALVLVEACSARVEELVMKHPRLRRLVENAWIRLGALDRDSASIKLWTSHGWKSPFLLRESSSPLPQEVASL